MAVKRKSRADTKAEASNLKISIREKTLIGIGDLLDVHLDAALELVEESETGKVNIAFGAEIDCSDTNPKLKLKMRFTKSETDSRTFEVDNPSQMNLWGNRPSESAGGSEEQGEGARFVAGSEGGDESTKLKRKARKKKATEAEAEPARNNLPRVIPGTSGPGPVCLAVGGPGLT